MIFLKLKSFFIRLDKLACLGSYACLFLGFNDVNSREALVEPLKTGKAGQRKLLYVKPFGENLATVKQLDMNPSSPRYGKPEFYEVVFQDQDDEIVGDKNFESSIKIIVHYSRMLHITGETLQSEWRGEPVLEPIYNRLKDLEKISWRIRRNVLAGSKTGLFRTSRS